MATGTVHELLTQGDALGTDSVVPGDPLELACPCGAQAQSVATAPVPAMSSLGSSRCGRATSVITASAFFPGPLPDRTQAVAISKAARGSPCLLEDGPVAASILLPRNLNQLGGGRTWRTTSTHPSTSCPLF